MRGFLAAFARLLALIGWVERVALVLLIANIVVNITAQVISRYLLGQPLVWVEEVATYSFIWATFLGASLALKHDRHVKIETFVGRLPPRLTAVFRALAFAVILALLLAVIGPVRTNAALEMRRTTIALPIDLPIGWFFSVPLLVGVALMALTSTFRLLGEARLALTGEAAPMIGGYLPVDEEDVEAERVLMGGVL